MRLKEQFKILTEFFNRENFDYAVIGAFALYAYGYTRATKDVDFITRFEYQDKIVKHLESLDFETLNCSEGYSNHLYSDLVTRIDLVYVSGITADTIFRSTQVMAVLRDFELPVIKPEHLIALKLFAVHNDHTRKYKEFADIKKILQLTDVDKDFIKNYARKYGMERYYDEIIRE